MNKRTEQVLAAGNGVGLGPHAGVQGVHVRRAGVGQRVVFEVAPPVFVGVEFGRVAREVFQVKSPTPPEPRPQCPALVGRQVVPDHHHAPTQVPEQVTQEVDDLFLADRPVPMKGQIPPQSAAARRDREASDDRDAPVVAGAVPQDRRLAARRPGPADQRMQEKAGFIDENEVGAMAGRSTLDPGPVLFDPAADGVLVTLEGSTLGFLRGKNRGGPSGAEWRRRDTTCRNGRRSAGRFADRSTGPWQSRRRRPLSRVGPPGIVAAGRSACRAAPGRVAPPRRPARLSEPAAPRGRRSAGWCPGDGRSRSGRTRVAAAPRPVAAAAPTARDFRGVSWFILSASEPNDDYYYLDQ